jgi:hypothetical protein
MHGIKITRVVLIIFLSLIFIGLSSRVQASIEFSVTEPSVKVTKDGKVVNKEPQVGDKLYISCKFTPTGSGLSYNEPVRFQFKVNGQVTNDVLAPVTPGKTILMGEHWVPNKAGNHVISCEVNPDKIYSETNYGDNKKEIWVTVAEKTPMVTLRKDQAGEVVATQPKLPPPSPSSRVTTSPKETITPTAKPILPKKIDLILENLGATVKTEKSNCSPMSVVVDVTITVRNVGTSAWTEPPKPPKNYLYANSESGLMGVGTPIPAIGVGESKKMTVGLRAQGSPPDLAGKKIHINAALVIDEGAGEDSNGNVVKGTVLFPANYCK